MKFSSESIPASFLVFWNWFRTVAQESVSKIGYGIGSTLKATIHLNLLIKNPFSQIFSDWCRFSNFFQFKNWFFIPELIPFLESILILLPEQPRSIPIPELTPESTFESAPELTQETTPYSESIPASESAPEFIPNTDSESGRFDSVLPLLVCTVIIFYLFIEISLAKKGAIGMIESKISNRLNIYWLKITYYLQSNVDLSYILSQKVKISEFQWKNNIQHPNCIP